MLHADHEQTLEEEAALREYINNRTEDTEERRWLQARMIDQEIMRDESRRKGLI